MGIKLNESSVMVFTQNRIMIYSCKQYAKSEMVVKNSDTINIRIVILTYYFLAINM